MTAQVRGHVTHSTLFNWAPLVVVVQENGTVFRLGCVYTVEN